MMKHLNVFKKTKDDGVSRMGLAPTPDKVLHTTTKAGPQGDGRRVPRSGRTEQMNSRVAEGFQAEVDKRAAAEGVTRGRMLEIFMAAYDRSKGAGSDVMLTALATLERIAKEESKARRKLVQPDEVLADMLANRCEELGLAVAEEQGDKRARKR